MESERQTTPIVIMQRQELNRYGPFRVRKIALLERLTKLLCAWEIASLPDAIFNRRKKLCHCLSSHDCIRVIPVGIEEIPGGDFSLKIRWGRDGVEAARITHQI